MVVGNVCIHTHSYTHTYNMFTSFPHENVLDWQWIQDCRCNYPQRPQPDYLKPTKTESQFNLCLACIYIIICSEHQMICYIYRHTYLEHLIFISFIYTAEQWRVKGPAVLGIKLKTFWLVVKHLNHWANTYHNTEKISLWAFRGKS